MTNNSKNKRELRLLSFNVLRPEWGKPGYPDWHQRRSGAVAVVRDVKPDLVALQEESRDQRNDIMTADTGLECAGIPSGNGGCILFRRSIFTLIKTDILSVPQRLAEQEERPVQWALLRLNSANATLLFYNAHLSPFEDAARIQGVEILLRHMMEIMETDTVVMIAGDLNATESEAPLDLLLSNSKPAFRSAWRESHGFHDRQQTARLVAAATIAGRCLLEAENAGISLGLQERESLLSCIAAAGQGTYHGYFDRARPGPIDFILVPESVEVLRAELVTEKYDHIFPSDHFPLWADLRLS